MKIDTTEARRIARLARLELTDDELEALAVDMTAILAFVQQLERAADDSGAPDAPTRATLRSDEPQEPLDRGAVADNAPEWRNGHFVVPRVLGD
jgi:aspartyl-tRNA(Asn)/glutamyl-tRNA(Gln) amidotransferase subunit C